MRVFQRTTVVALALALIFPSAGALAQNTGKPIETTAAGGKMPATGIYCDNGSGKAAQCTFPVTIASLPIPAGAATAANQATGNSSLAAIQSSLASPLPLFTGAATAANQSTGNTSLASIDGKLPSSLGAKAGSASFSVVPASDGFATSMRDLGTVTFTNATSAATLFTADTSGFGGITFQLTGTWAGTVTFESSNDNVNFVATTALSTTNAAASTTTANGIWYYSGGARFFRARVTAYTSGTVSGSALLRQVSQNSIAPATSVNIGTNAALVAGTATIGNVALAPVGATPATAYTRYSLSSSASTNAAVVKATAGKVFGGVACNTVATLRFVKLYSKATAPTVGTDVPVLTIPLPASSCLYVADAVGVYGLYFTAGIGIAVTGAFADTDATAVAAGDVLINLLYL